MICEHLRRVRNDPRFHWGPPYKRASSPTHFVMLRLKGHPRTIPQIGVAAQHLRLVTKIPTMKPLDTPKSEKKPEEVGIIGGAKGTVEIEIKDEPIDFSNVQIEPLFQNQVDFDTFSKSDFRAVKVKECEAVKKSKKLLKFVLDDGTGVDRVILSGIHEYYEPEELVGKTCIAITNLPPRAMMGIDSCGMLISAVHHENGEEKLHLLMVDPHIPAGAKLY